MAPFLGSLRGLLGSRFEHLSDNPVKQLDSLAIVKGCWVILQRKASKANNTTFARINVKVALSTLSAGNTIQLGTVQCDTVQYSLRLSLSKFEQV